MLLGGRGGGSIDILSPERARGGGVEAVSIKSERKDEFFLKKKKKTKDGGEDIRESESTYIDGYPPMPPPA